MGVVAGSQRDVRLDEPRSKAREAHEETDFTVRQRSLPRRVGLPLSTSRMEPFPSAAEAGPGFVAEEPEVGDFAVGPFDQTGCVFGSGANRPARLDRPRARA